MSAPHSHTPRSAAQVADSAQALAALDDRELLGAVREIFGHNGLRPGQREIIDDVLGARPVIAVMPTGAGKSLCYQLPAVMAARSGGVTLVISPLIALMKDQVDALTARGVRAAALTSAASPAEQSELIDGIRAGLYTLVYVAPERLRSPRFIDALRSLGSRLALLAIDEAHCISEWGHDFRPDYRRIGELVKALSPPRLIALTATATPEVRTDIAEQLGLTDAVFHVRGFDRPNLIYTVEPVSGNAAKVDRIVERVRSRAAGTALVYAATRKNAEKYAAGLGEAGMRVRVYHAGLADTDRSEAQDEFMDGKLDAIVATNAFGMGVDKSDIRLVIHGDIPRSAEAYYQEAGRGGRDGGETECVLLFGHGDVRLQEFLIDASYPTGEQLRGLWKYLRECGGAFADPDRLKSELPGEPHASTVRSALRMLERHGLVRSEGDVVVACSPEPGSVPLDVDGIERRADVEKQKLRLMVEYAYLPTCRRQYLLSYFGDEEWRDRQADCKGCDNCRGTGTAREADDTEVRAAKALLQLVSALSGRFGRTRFVQLALGVDDDPRFAELPERGSVRGLSQARVLDVMRALEGSGLVETSRGEYPTIEITSRGKKALKDPNALGQLAVVPRKGSGGRAKKARSGASGSGPVEMGDLDQGLLNRLKELRTALATEREVPAYVIFSNKTLEAIARAKPQSPSALEDVPGIGPQKLEFYGADILAITRE